MAAIVTLILSGGKSNDNPFDNMQYRLSPESETRFDIYIKTPTPRYFLTHLPFTFLDDCFKRSQPKVIYIMRNPFDQLVSYYHFYRMYVHWGQFTGSWDEFYTDYYKKGKLFYGDYFESVGGWWDVRDEHKDHILYIKYEDLVRDTRVGVLKVASFLGKDLNEEAIVSILDQVLFKNMKDNPKLNMTEVQCMDKTIVPFLRKGIVGDWRSHFNKEQEEEMYNMFKEKILSRGLQFDLGGNDIQKG